MKRILSYVAAAAATILAISSCEEPAPLVPEIQLGKKEVSLASDGASVKVVYAVENAVEGESLSSSCEADWLQVDLSKARMVTLSANTNETGEERTTTVTFSYPGAQDVVLTVKQDFFVNPLSIEVSSVNATGVVFSVRTTDPNLTWLPMVTYKESFEYYETPDELFNSDIEYFKYLADINDYTLPQFLEMMVATGPMDNVSLGGLQPSTDYVLYAYGVTTDARRTTDIVSFPFTTEDPYEGDITFRFETSEEDYILDFKIYPSHTGVPYYYGIVTQQQWDMWSAAYKGDVSAAIQAEDIDAMIEDLMDLGMMSGPEDYFLLFSESDVMDFGYFELTADTEYVLFASRWTEDCKLVGPLSTHKHKSQSIAPSDNKLTLAVDGVTQSSAVVHITTTNDDPYAVINLRSSELEGMTDEEIFAFVTTKYDYILSEYTFKGNLERRFDRMRPDVDYTFLAFGYKAGTMTTADMQKVEIKTYPAGDPKDCTFEFTVDPDVDNAFVTITPSDKGQFYFWLVYPSDYTAEAAKSYITMYVRDWYENDFAAFASWELSLGDDAATAWDLYPDTEYKVGAVIMDYDTGEFLSDVFFSEPFVTPIKQYADITFDWNYGPYYDLGELIRAGQTQFEPLLAQGDALMPIEVKITGSYSAFYYDIYTGDVSDAEMYPDEMFYAGLEYGSSRTKNNAIVKYDAAMTLVAVAYDNENNPTMLYRDLLRFTQDGASPAKDFIASMGTKSTGDEQTIKAGEFKQNIPVASKKKNENRISAAQLEAKHNEAMTKVEQMRNEKLIKEFNAAKMRKEKRIAR